MSLISSTFTPIKSVKFFFQIYSKTWTEKNRSYPRRYCFWFGQSHYTCIHLLSFSENIVENSSLKWNPKSETESCFEYPMESHISMAENERRCLFFLGLWCSCTGSVISNGDGDAAVVGKANSCRVFLVLTFGKSINFLEP